jgi:hypothetical protein
MTTEQRLVLEGQRYVAAQRAKIDAQRKFIRDLEMSDQDAEKIWREKRTLGDMVERLDLVLRRLRPVIDQVGYHLHEGPL